MPLDYHLLDVFTDVPFGGNALAVFPDGRGVDDITMQRLARELNLSETTFVLPPDVPGATHRVRIFTPGAEMPFAGHPTIGTAVLLAMREQPEAEQVDFRFSEGIGLVPVQVRRRGRAWTAELTTAIPPRTWEAPPAALFAEMLALQPDDVHDGAHAPFCSSCGLPFNLVRVRDLDALARVTLRTDRWLAHDHAQQTPMVLVYTLETGDPHVHVRARMFAPDVGVPEDPATGSAVSALSAAMLRDHALADGTHRFTVHQGVEMGRPSELRLTMTVEGGAVREVKVAGGAVTMGEGRFFV
jgi:trans-2,3-dihydro-3-hydroxyanthranilate isomerase